ncbi:MAG TPA: N-acetylglucosamine-6-phosphate deacetylase [Thermoanaerobaculia bacterium]
MRQHLFGRAFVDGKVQDDILVTLDEGVIADVARAIDVPGDTLHVNGLITPGFIDTHIHGGDGADFMDADDAANARILSFHAQQGTTALAATTLSSSRGDLMNAVEAIARANATHGAEVVAVHLEGPYINSERAGAQNRASIRPADIQELAALIAMAPRLRWIVTVAPEVEGVHSLIEHFRDRVLFSIGHTAATYAEAVAALDWGAAHFTHLFNAMTSFGHREPGVVGAAFTAIDATAELIADGVHVHPAVLRFVALTMPHRVTLITDAMRACGLSEGNYHLYEYPITVADGAARLVDGTLAGSVLTMSRAVQNMVELAGVPLDCVLPLATEVPARVLGVADRKGKLEVGYDADVVVLTERFEVEHVWVRGRKLAS